MQRSPNPLSIEIVPGRLGTHAVTIRDAHDAPSETMPFPNRLTAYHAVLPLLRPEWDLEHFQC